MLLLPLNQKQEASWRWLPVRIMIPIRLPVRINKKIMDNSHWMSEHPCSIAPLKDLYPPGSTYKPLGALVGLDEGVITQASGYPCLGVYLACRHPVKCLENWPGHAANLRLAIAHSCNSFFCNTFRLTVDNRKIGNVA